MRAAQQGINSITTRVRFWILIDDLGKQLFPLALYRRTDRIYSKYHRHLSNPQHCRLPGTRSQHVLRFYNTYDTLWVFSRKTVFWTDVVDGISVEKFTIFDTAIAYHDQLRERRITFSCVIPGSSVIIFKIGRKRAATSRRLSLDGLEMKWIKKNQKLIIYVKENVVRNYNRICTEHGVNVNVYMINRKIIRECM